MGEHEQAALRTRWRGFLLSVAPLALLFLALMSAGVLLAPAPVRAVNQPDQFDAVAAQARLARVLGDETPHPVDSAAGDRVRAALIAEIEALGVTPEVRERFVCRAQPRGPLIDCAMTRNILFSIGPEQGPAVLAATHYDSVPAAPGASDAGIGIAAWLEVARLMQREELARRVIFLISDGEEPALLGAHGFAQHDPEFAAVEAMVNLEARGTRGPAVFFESNQPNADAVAAFARAPRGIANSVMADVYALLSNSTDVTALSRPGLDVINLSLVEGLEDYHTPHDELASLDTRSLQHMGDIALAAMRALARAPDRGDETTLVYTDIASRAFIAAPSWLGQGALALSALICFAAFWRAGAVGRWRAFAAPPLALVLAGLSAAAAGLLLGFIRPGQAYWFAHPEPTRAWCALLALLAVAASLMALRIAKAPAQIGAAGAFWFAAIGGVASLALPGLSILFALPAAFYAAGALAAFAWPHAQAVGAALAALAATLIWAPTLYLVELALGFDMPFALAVLVALLSLTWLGAIARARQDASWRPAALVLGAGAAAAMIVAALVPAASGERPRALNTLYFVDLEAGEAHVLAGPSRRALPRSVADALVFAPRAVLPGDQQTTWAAPAPLAPTPAPALDQLDVGGQDGARTLRARLVMNGAYRAIVRIPRSAAPTFAAVEGVETSFADTGADADADYFNLACQGRACDGAEIVIAFAGDSDLRDWFLIGQYPGAASPAAAVAARRPASATPIQFGDGTLTLSRLGERAR